MAEKFSFPKLSTTNWISWKFRMEQLLVREDLWWVVDEAKPEPVTDEWRKDDRKAKATIGLCVEENQIALIKDAANAKACWNALKSHYEKNTVTSRVSLLKRLCGKNLTEEGNMVNHLLELDEIFDRLQAAGLELERELKVAMILRSLPESYSGLVMALEARPDDDITIDLVKQKLTDEYQKRVDIGSINENKALRTSAKNSDQKVCFYCKKPGHFRRDCRKYLASKSDDDDSKQQAGGSKQEERKAKQVLSSDFPLCFLVTNDAEANCVENRKAERAAACSVSGGQNRSWYVDSGATHHMTCDKSFFATFVEGKRVPVTLANGERTMSKGCGSGIVRCLRGNGQEVDLKLENVLWVPKLDSGLLSVAVINSKGFSVVFDANGCKVLNKAGHTVVLADRCGGLYSLRTAEKIMVANASNHSTTCQHTWHRRFGHRDCNVIEQMVKKDMGVDMKVEDCGLRLVCECCMQGKLPRTPFPKKSTTRTSEILELVHTDVCGPFENVTPGGKKYFLTLIDDFSRYTVLYLLAKKSEVPDKIQEYVRSVEKEFGKKPRTIRSDNGGEYVNRRLEEFYKEEGIRAEFTVPYSPQQNGVAERKNRYLQEMALCMLIDAKLPKRFWGEAMVTATFLQNRLPSRSIGCTPFEKWFKQKPNMKDLKIFGCQALVPIPSAAEKEKMLIFVGYDNEGHACRFLDSSTNRITISDEAKFLELDSQVIGSKEEKPKESHEVPEEVVVEIGTRKERKLLADDSTEEFYGFDEGLQESGQELVADPKDGPRTSGRVNKGSHPIRLHDYVVGKAVCVSARTDKDSAMKRATGKLQ